MENKELNYFIELNKINVNDKTEEKNGLTYLSWAWAWGEVKKLHPTATYTIYETTNPQGYVTNYFTDGKTCWVKTGVTINGIEHIEELPVMDFKNRSISLDNVTSFDINKTIQRSLTKACARHGIGLYIYAGEDLPEDEKEAEEKKKPAKETKEVKKETESKIVIGGKITEQQLEQLEKLEITEKEKICNKNNINSLTELPMEKASAYIAYYKQKGVL